MTDILADWKKNRFILPDCDITNGVKCAVLTDVAFWVEHLDELTEWCRYRNCTQTGMVVEFFDEVSMVEFVLRWS